MFVSWLFRILTNKCLDRLRKKKNDVPSLAEIDLPSEPSDISNESESLRKAIERLSNEHKTLVILRFEQQFSISQIAAILNVPEGTVRSRLHRTLVRLREILGVTL
jgi:RNA polymerase sigma factor (sigma-70 family)